VSCNTCFLHVLLRKWQGRGRSKILFNLLNENLETLPVVDSTLYMIHSITTFPCNTTYLPRAWFGIYATVCSKKKKSLDQTFSPPFTDGIPIQWHKYVLTALHLQLILVSPTPNSTSTWTETQAISTSNTTELRSWGKGKITRPFAMCRKSLLRYSYSYLPKKVQVICKLYNKV
jgi:hypothetical protein